MNILIYTADHRGKRGILALGLSLLSGIVKGTTWFIKRKRENVMMKNIDILGARTDILLDKYNDLSERMVTYANVNNEVIKSLHKNLTTIKSDIHYFNGVIKLVQNNFVSLNESLRLVQVYTFNNRIYNMVNAQALQIMAKITEYFRTSESIFETTLNGLHQLEMGEMPIAFVGRRELRDALRHISLKIQKDYPDFELLFSNERDIYKQNDISYHIEGQTLIIQVPLYLKRKLSSPMTLYKIDTVFVPFLTDDTSQDKDRPSFTKLDFPKPYVAINQDYFIPLSTEDLAQCIKYDHFYVCLQKLLHLHRSTTHCLAAIYWDKDMEEIISTCPFKYYYNIKPEPQILDASDYILISNLPTPWHVFCIDIGYPEKFEGDSYALLTRDTLCQCNIDGTMFSLKSDMLACHDKSKHERLTHPINSVVAYGLKHVFPHFKENNIKFDTKTVYTSDISMALKSLKNIPEYKDTDILEDPNHIEPQELQRVIDLLAADHQAYLNEMGKRKWKDDFKNWFHKENSFFGFIFVGGLCGSIAILLIIGIVCYTGRLKLLLGTLFASIPTTEAHEIIPTQCHNYLEHLLISACFHIFYALIGLIVFFLLRRLYHKFILFKWYIPVNGNSHCKTGKTHLFLELFNSNSKTILYIGSVRASVINFQICSKVKVLNLTYSKTCILGYLNITWSHTNFILNNPLDLTLEAGSDVSHGSIFTVPSKLLLGPLQSLKVCRMMQEKVCSRLLLQDQYLYVINPISIINPTSHNLALP